MYLLTIRFLLQFFFCFFVVIYLLPICLSQFMFILLFYCFLIIFNYFVLEGHSLGHQQRMGWAWSSFKTYSKKHQLLC